MVGALARDALGVTGWVVLGVTAGLLAGVGLVLLARCLLVRRGLFDWGRPYDRWIRVAVVALWSLTIPSCLLVTGGTIGTAQGARWFVQRSRTSEMICRVVVRPVVAFALAAVVEPKLQLDELAARSRAYMDGKRDVEIAFLAEHVEAPRQALLRIGADTIAKITGRTSWFEKGLASLILGAAESWVSHSEAKAWFRAARPVIEDLRTRDKETDGNGRVTAQEIAVSIYRVHLGSVLGPLVFHAIAVHAVPFALAAVGFLLLPVVMLCPIAWLLRRRSRRAAQPIS